MTSITFARGAALTGVMLLTGCLLLSACGGGPSVSSAAAPAQPPAAGVHAASGSYLRATPGGLAAASSGGSSAVQTARLAVASQNIIYTAGMTVRSASALVTAKQAVAIVTADGGYTSAEDATAGSSGNSGGTVSLTLKVPVPVYAQVLGELSAPTLGRQLSLQQHSTDVTQEVADVNSLVTSQQAAITALQGLLRHAANVDQLLQVQQQISSDESELESLQAQQRALDHETSYATINMTLLSTQHRAHPRKHHSGSGFGTGLGSGWRALQHATTWLLTALGAALPFLIIAVILAGLGYAGRRRLSRRRTGPTAVS